MRLSVSLLSLIFAVNCVGQSGSGEGQAADIPNLIFNCDGCSTSLSNFEPPISIDQLCRPVAELAGTRVGVFLHCVSLGGDVYNYPTKVGQMYGKGITDWDSAAATKTMRNQGLNLKSLVERGIDPIEALAARTHEQNMRFWVSVRMNDQHEDDEKRFGSKVTEFKKQNRHLLIERDYPPYDMSYAPISGYTYAWNYAKQEVRDRRLALVSELLSYDGVDGIELDFCRAPVLFKYREEAQGVPLMTDFMRQVRKLVNDRREQGKPNLVLAVRVPPDVAVAKAAGLDVEQWIKEGLIDLVVPMDGFYMDMQPRLRPFVEAAKGTGVKVFAGLENYTWGYSTNITREHAFAAASSFYEQGADGLYLYNFDCHRRNKRENDYTPEELALLRDLAAKPAAFAVQDKHYFITRNLKPDMPGTLQLPATLNRDKHATFTIEIGDDLAAPRTRQALRSIELRIMVPGLKTGGNALVAQWNSKPVKLSYVSESDGRFVATITPLVHQGTNTISLGLGPNVQTEEKLLVDRIEVIVDYK